MSPDGATPRLEPRPHSLSPRGLTIAAWTALLLFGAIFLLLAWNVSTHDTIVIVDATVANWLHAHASPLLTRFMLTITTLNSTFAICGWSVLLGLLLWRMGERYWVLTLALAVGGGLALNVILKDVYERARPHFEDPMVTLQTYSFPSGHTAGATLFYGVLAAFLVSRTNEPNKRVACVIAAVLMVALVAFSRIYLGAHYLSDVAAAACSSTVWLVLCLSAVHAVVRKHMENR